LSLLLAVLLLPSLFWDKEPETIDQLQQAGIDHISVAPANADAWKNATGISVEIKDPTRFTKAATPGVAFRANMASATRAPWVDSNGWRFLRQPDGHFYYDASGPGAALAAAEAFAYAVDAAIRTGEEGLKPLARMLKFLDGFKGENFVPMANIGFLDDGSAESSEFMNLLVRRNLLFRVVKQPDPKLDLMVTPGSVGYPKTEAANPSLLAEKVRANLTDEKRSLRIYGSEVVVGRLVESGAAVRLYLINYGAARSPVRGLRVRVLGVFSKQHASQFDSAETNLMDVSAGAGATEFTVPELKTFAIINLDR
jgi:hypothetical protein